MNGDFNYDGVVDGSDYTLIVNAFNQQDGSLTRQIASSLAETAGQIAGAPTVPEPMGISLLALGGAGLIFPRRNLEAKYDTTRKL